jgi:hypothetical protein
MDTNTPVVIIVYNRPAHTKKLLNKLKTIKPKIIVIISDGPKNDYRDKRKCETVQKIIKKIEWKCKKIYISSKFNMGLKERIYSGLKIFFKKYKKAIILEDDCQPDKSFFIYCEKILELYKNNKRIAGISGNKFNKVFINNSFYFSKYSSIWGWATWRRVWDDFDINIKFWPRFKKSKKWLKICPDTVEREFWNNIFNNAYNGNNNSWAYAYLLNNFYKNRLTVVPRYNLIKNIGFGENSTNTKVYNNKFFPKIKSLESELIIPNKIQQNHMLDKIDFSNVFGGGRRNTYPLKFFYMLYLKFFKIKI